MCIQLCVPLLLHNSIGAHGLDHYLGPHTSVLQ